MPLLLFYPIFIKSLLKVKKEKTTDLHCLLTFHYSQEKEGERSNCVKPLLKSFKIKNAIIQRIIQMDLSNLASPKGGTCILLHPIEKRTVQEIILIMAYGVGSSPF